MTTVNMLDAKTRLSQLVEAVESGAEAEILIARNGRPAARLVGLSRDAAPRLGVARGRFAAPADTGADDAAVAALFTGEDPST